MPTITLSQGHSLHYEDDDFSDPWTVPPAVLLHHGWGRSSRYWYGWVPTLARDYRVIRVDARGLGKSGFPGRLEEGITVEGFVQDVAEVVERLALGPVHYCGEALGGIVGALYGASHPGCLRSLTLVATPSRVTDDAAQLYSFGFDSWPTAMRRLGVKEWARRANSNRFGPEAPPGLMEWYVEETAKNDVEVLCRLVAAARGTDITTALAQILVPSLVLYPESARLANLVEKAVLTDQLINSRVVEFPSSGHQIVSMFPDGCARAMHGFISEVDNDAERSDRPRGQSG